MPAAGRLSAGGTSGQLWEELRHSGMPLRGDAAGAGGRGRVVSRRAAVMARAGRAVRRGNQLPTLLPQPPTISPKWATGARAVAWRMCSLRLESHPSAAQDRRAGELSSRRHKMRNSLGAPFVLQALSQKPMNRARPLPALSPHPSNKRKAVNNRRRCRPLRPLAQLRTALSDGSHEAQLSLCTAGVRGSISLWPATTGSKSARQGVGLPLGSSRAV